MARNLVDLTGKTALITGGNGGLGLAYATGVAKAGADVVIWGRAEAKNEASLPASHAARQARVQAISVFRVIDKGWYHRRRNRHRHSVA